MNKRLLLFIENYIKVNCDNESALIILKYIDDVFNDFKLTLERFESLLKIDGINSKKMVLEDIQDLLKEMTK